MPRLLAFTDTHGRVEALRPAVLVCGHCHGDFGKTDRVGDTRVVNPGPLGMWIEP